MCATAHIYYLYRTSMTIWNRICTKVYELLHLVYNCCKFNARWCTWTLWIIQTFWIIKNVLYCTSILFIENPLPRAKQDFYCAVPIFFFVCYYWRFDALWCTWTWCLLVSFVVSEWKIYYFRFGAYVINMYRNTKLHE